MGHWGPSSQHSMGHFSIVFVKTKIFYGPFNFCMGHLHRITKLYVSNGPCPLPSPITEYYIQKGSFVLVKVSLYRFIYMHRSQESFFY